MEWSEWFPWESFLRDARIDPDRIKVPSKPGVYEAKFINSEYRLTIGKASNLRMRVKQGLVKGKVPHSSGNKIREIEPKSNIVIRWALTDRPSCVEEDPHKKYLLEFGELPKFTLRT